MRVDSGHAGNGLADVEDLIAGQDIVSQILERCGPFTNVHDLVPGPGEIPGGSHSLDTGQRLGPGGVDGPDTGVGMGAAEDLSVEQARGLEVGAVQSAARDLIGSIVANGSGADHIELLGRQDYVGFVLGGGHAFVSCILPAASMTARIILS